MKKLFFGLILIFFIILGSTYTLLFTSYGNKIISSYIEEKINNGQNLLRFKVNNFQLTLNSIIFDAKIDENSYINIFGNLSLLNQSLDLKYDIKVDDLSSLKNLTNHDLRGSFFTNGTFKGDKKDAIISGISNISNSKIKYFINLSEFKIKDIVIASKDARIEDFLHLFNKPIFAKANFTLNADVKNININNLDGNVTLKIEKGKFDNEVVNKEFKQTIQSNINFQGDTQAIFLGNKIEIKSDFITSLADLFIEKAVVDLSSNKINSDYKIDIKNLNKLEGIIGKKFNGEFWAIGNLFSENNKIKIDGKSNIFESTTTYDVDIENLLLQGFKFAIQDAKLEKLFFLLNEPVYAMGDFDIQGNVNNAKFDNLDGKIVSKITNAKIINEVVNTVFKQEIKENVNFDLQVDTLLFSNQAKSKISAKTNIATLNTNDSIYDFKEGVFFTDYLLDIPSLEKIKDFTKTKLRGKIQVKGELKNKENFLEINGKSDILGGVLDFYLKNDDLIAKLNNISVKEFSYMLFNPEIFDSKGNFDLVYNLLTKKGEIKAMFLNGHFLANNFSNLINQLSKFD